MKKMTFFTPFLLVFSILLVSACHKSSGDLPTLTIASPLVDDQFANGQVITIKGEVSDAVKLHKLSIKITDDKTGAVLYTNEPNVHNKKSYTYDVSWTVKVSDWIDATVTVTAENHEGQQAVKTVKVGIWL